MDQIPPERSDPPPRTGPAGSYRPRTRPPRVQLTERDRLLLEFLADHRLVRAAQVGALLGVTSRTAATRLNRLATAGYLERDAPFRHQPEHYQIKRQGLAAIGSELRAPNLDLSCYEHDVGLGWVWLAARAGAFGPLSELISEREMRSRDGRVRTREDALSPPVQRLGVRVRGEGPNGGERLHYPDLLLETHTGHRVAVELELTDKGRKRIDQIIGSYAADGRINAVLYLVPDDNEKLGRQLQASARKHGIAKLVHVQRVHIAEPAGIPARTRAAERSRASGSSSSRGSDGEVSR